MQSQYVDLLTDSKAQPAEIHLGFKLGTEYLNTHSKKMELFGINHVMLN